MITLDYLELDKDKRVKKFMHIMDGIYDYASYEDYLEFTKRILDDCKEKDCRIGDLHYKYPEEIKW